MGTLRSEHDHAGLEVNGVTLGVAARELDGDGNPVGLFFWDDGRLPSGVVDADGVVVVDEPEVV